MRLKDIITSLEHLAPPSLQEAYDNSGLITGNPDWEIRGAMLCLDSVEAVLDEAIEKKCNLIVAHHPIVFGGLKRFTGRNYVERVIIKAIKHDLAIYAIHTNLDNVVNGVNAKIAEKLGLKELQILSPKENTLSKLAVFCPQTHADEVRDALFAAGAGQLGNYDECSFNSAGIGSFKPNDLANPHVGSAGSRHREPEEKIEVMVPNYTANRVISAMKKAHPYEEVAYDLVALKNVHSGIGSGMIGSLPEPLSSDDFIKHLKEKMKVKVVRATNPVSDKVRKVAVCGGSGSFLLGEAIRQGADVFVSADFKYHQFFDADRNIQIADIGHYESEQFTMELLAEHLSRNFPKFALHFTTVNTNPINYC